MYLGWSGGRGFLAHAVPSCPLDLPTVLHMSQPCTAVTKGCLVGKGRMQQVLITGPPCMVRPLCALLVATAPATVFPIRRALLEQGHRVKLDLSHLDSFRVFPGQVIAVRGVNPSGGCLIASRVLPPAPLPPSLHGVPGT